jgi:GNAT superfamily N-acetyltransferase
MTSKKLPAPALPVDRKRMFTPTNGKCKTDAYLFDKVLPEWIRANSILEISVWFEVRKLYKVYLRNFQDIIEGERVRTLVVSNITIQPRLRGKGIYDLFLRQIEAVAKTNGVYCVVVENVWIEEQYGIYLRRGYKPMGRSPECFYKSLEPTSTIEGNSASCPTPPSGTSTSSSAMALRALSAMWQQLLTLRLLPRLKLLRA